MKEFVISARIKNAELIEKIEESPLSHTELINAALMSYFFPKALRIRPVYRKNSNNEYQSIQKEVDEFLKEKEAV